MSFYLELSQCVYKLRELPLKLLRLKSIIACKEIDPYICLLDFLVRTHQFGLWENTKVVGPGCHLQQLGLVKLYRALQSAALWLIEASLQSPLDLAAV